MEHRFRTAIQTEFAAGGLRGTGKIRNVAEGGLFVGTEQLPDQGDTVRVSFRSNGTSVDVEGLVWWTTEDSPGPHRARGFGMRLLYDSEEYERFLASLMD